MIGGVLFGVVLPCKEAVRSHHAGCRGALDSCNVQRAIDVHPMNVTVTVHGYSSSLSLCLCPLLLLLTGAWRCSTSAKCYACCRSHDGPEAAATVFVCFLCDSLGITHTHTFMRPRNSHDAKYNDSSRASVSRCTRSINPIIASSLRRRVQLLPAHCRSQPGQEGDLDLARGESECLHSFSCWPGLAFCSSFANSFMDILISSPLAALCFDCQPAKD
jgi:hypothetical protein